MKFFSIIFSLFILVNGCKNGVTANVANNKDSVTSPANKPADAAESIFVIEDTFKTQDNKNFVLSSLAGKPTVVAMIFTTCGYACPRLTSEMTEIYKRLNENKSKVNFLLVSFDVEKDTPERLKEFAKRMDLDSNWTLLHGDETTVRTLSVLLNVQFEKDALGSFSHSNVISVLDKTGALYFQKTGLTVDQQETVDKVKGLL